MLREAVNGHIDLYQNMGFKYRVQAYALRSFADFAERRSEEFVRADSVLEWAASAPSVRQRHHRLNIVHRLACALHAEDRRHEVPPTGAFGAVPRRPRSCHIFTQDEIDSLLRAASELAPQGSIRPITYTTLLSLIACAGLRISEALKLELSDLTEDGLVIRATKFQKSRGLFLCMKVLAAACSNISRPAAGLHQPPPPSSFPGTGASFPIPQSLLPFSSWPDRLVCAPVPDTRAAAFTISDTHSRCGRWSNVQVIVELLRDT